MKALRPLLILAVLLFAVPAHAQMLGVPGGGDPGLKVFSAAGVGGSGTANRVAYWSAATTLTSDADFTFDGTNATLGSSSQLCFSTDTGLRRDAAGSVSFTNCSTGHATGLGLGTTTPATILGSARPNDSLLHVLDADGHGFLVAGGPLGAVVAVYDSNGTTDRRMGALAFNAGIITLSRWADAFSPEVPYLSGDPSTDAVTLGSANVAGLTLNPGTANVLVSANTLGFGAVGHGTAPVGTVGSGTGVTVNATADLRRAVYKATFTYAAFSAAATTADKTLYTLAAKQRLVGIIADVTVTFTGGAVSDADMTCGKTAGGNEYLVSFDVDTATSTVGLADAELGTSINRAGAIQGGDLPSWTATTAVQCRLTTVGANTNALTAGTMVVYLITEMM